MVPVATSLSLHLSLQLIRAGKTFPLTNEPDTTIAVAATHHSPLSAHGSLHIRINIMAIANPLLNFVVRGFQALFGIVVLGISVSLIRGHHWGGLPASLGFSAFVGGVTILGAALGVAGLFFSFLDGMIGLIVDGVVAVINAAGGIVSASPSSEGALGISQLDIPADKDTGSRSQDLWCGLRWRHNVKKRGQARFQRHLQRRLQSRRRMLVLLRRK